ncbi:MAG TPA: ABC transporter permease [Sphingomonadaceae bacterium]|nr:ABC transporter permease [Sphingomonadaceae bacterium]
MREWADFEVAEQEGGTVKVALTGPLLVSTIGVLDRELRKIQHRVDVVDLSGCGACDTVGAWTVWRFADAKGARIIGESEETGALIKAVRVHDQIEEIEPPHVPLLRFVPAAVGHKMFDLGGGTLRLLGFFGAILVATFHLLRHPSRFRTNSLIRQIELVGVTSLPIIGLMSFLIGIVIAQQGAVQLEQFGAEILTINLVGRLSLRELGILMTAIMVAGRSGSAFAAQIGTMKLTEEVDAMRTIGVSPVEALIIPRILAAVLLMPLLGFYSALVAIIGGAVISDITLGIPFWTFLNRIQDVVPVHDLWVGLIKGPVFGLIVALAGCYQGMQVEGNAEEVGIRTTKAVVQGIFMVIVLDAFFAVFFTEVGWG